MVALETDRLMIRGFGPDDWRALQKMIVIYQASESAKYEDPWPTSDEDMKNIAGWFASGDNYLAVWLKDTAALIGMIAIEPREGQEQRVHNLGYIFHPGYHGHGYATEGCRAAMDYLFGTLGVDRILTGTRLENRASVALLGRLGLRAIGNGEFTMSRDEWSGKRQES